MKRRPMKPFKTLNPFEPMEPMKPMPPLPMNNNGMGYGYSNGNEFAYTYVTNNGHQTVQVQQFPGGGQALLIIKI